MALWGGRFTKDESILMKDFNSSLDFDKRLYKEDIEGSIAHVTMLYKCGIISEEEGKQIIAGLCSILKDIEEGRLIIEGDYEDIHSFVEGKLIEKIGDTGKKLHTARSRNDQVAVDMRLYAKKKAKTIVDSLEVLKKEILSLGEKNNFIMPGYTHLQRAQVVTFKYYMKAYHSMFIRDTKRLNNAIELLDENPLGCCALAGTTYDTDRNITSELLGFNAPVENFMDGVSDRDYLVELTSAFSLIMMHLSRLSEELIIWSSKEFDFIQIGDEFSTGSSIMPQKKNPDACELIRGKTGRVYGSLMSLLTILKGLPLAYNKDMQEDKEQFFDALDTVQKCINITAAMLPTITVKKESMLRSIKKGFLNATEAADYLVNKGMAFRDAHRVIGLIIVECEAKEIAIEDMPISELKKHSDLFEEDIYNFINYENTLKRGIKNAML
jgi:argininosuccinate lyase